MERYVGANGTRRQINLFMDFVRKTLNRDRIGATASPSRGPWDYDVLFAAGNQSWKMHAAVKTDSLTSEAVSQLVAMSRDFPKATPLVIAPFISAQLQTRLRESGINYWDSTGNSYLDIALPRLLVRTVGAVRDPYPRAAKSAQVSLRGKAAARVVIFLLSNPEPPVLRTVARETGVGLGTVGRVLDLLRREGVVIETGERARLTSRADLIARWVDDYSFLESSKVRRFVASLGAKQTLDRIRQSGLDYALTGLAAQQLLIGHGVVAVFASDERWLYIGATDSDLERLGLIRVPYGGNFVVMSGPKPEGLLGNTLVQGQLVANEWRVTADLLSSPGRERAAGEQLLALLLKSTNDFPGAPSDSD